MHLVSTGIGCMTHFSTQNTVDRGTKKYWQTSAEQHSINSIAQTEFGPLISITAAEHGSSSPHSPKRHL